MASTQQTSSYGLTRLLPSFSLAQIPLLVISVVVLHLVARGIYRVYFHPLSKFPGPKIRAFTRIPSHIEQWKGTKHLSLAILHQQYGHVVRVSPDELSWTDPNAWRDVYGHGTKGTKGSPPHKAWNRYGNGINGSPSMLQARDEAHTRQRKIFTPAFSDRALRQQEPLFQKYTDLLISKLREGLLQDPKKDIDMVQMFNFTTFDVMGDLTFGEPLHMLDKNTWDPWVSTVFAGIKTGSKMSIILSYPLIWKPFKAWKKPGASNAKRREHFKHSADRVTKRLEKGRDNEGVDLWDFVLNQEEGKGLTRGEMDSNASLFMLAGTETTATLVSGLTYYLLKSPDKMQTLVDEIRSTFISADEMTMAQLAAMPYLNACLKEALRMYPPVPLGLPRMTPEDGSTVCGQFVPPGTTLVIPHYAMYTLEKNFKRPLVFIPERWLGDAEFKDDERNAVQPFSVGSRDCVGKNMAYHEMRLIMAKVLHAFDFKLAESSDNWKDQQTYSLWQKKPLMCKLNAVN